MRPIVLAAALALAACDGTADPQPPCERIHWREWDPRLQLTIDTYIDCAGLAGECWTYAEDGAVECFDAGGNEIAASDFTSWADVPVTAPPTEPLF